MPSDDRLCRREIAIMDGIPVRPIQNTIDCPTWRISRFLDEHIRPIFDEKCQTTSIINSIGLLQRFEDYKRKGLLKSTTLFCTFDIKNLYTMLPQEESLDILIEFFQYHRINKVKDIDIHTIRILASIVFEENYFVYDKYIYKQVIGGAMGSSFTLTLANIFMWKWQKELVRQQDVTCELYMRYIDDVLITWNRSKHQLCQLLHSANTWHPNIKLNYDIGQCLPFLDILLENRSGTLFTSNYHKPSSQPYVIPFTSDHPRHVFANTIQGALTRAIRYSSTVDAFERERIRIRLMSLMNGYPSTFIEKQFRISFGNNMRKNLFLSSKIDEEIFKTLRERLSNDDQSINQQAQQILQQQTEKITKELENRHHPLIIHYTHEKRFHSMKREIHQVHDGIFKKTLVQDTRLIVGSRNRRDNRHELVHKKPNIKLLRNRETTHVALTRIDDRQQTETISTSKQ